MEAAAYAYNYNIIAHLLLPRSEGDARERIVAMVMDVMDVMAAAGVAAYNKRMRRRRIATAARRDADACERAANFFADPNGMFLCERFSPTKKPSAKKAHHLSLV